MIAVRTYANQEKLRPKCHLKSLLLVALLVIPSSFAYIEFYLFRPPEERPTGLTVNADEFQSIWSVRQVQLMGIGDSLAGSLMIYDALAADVRKMSLQRDADCPLCGDAPSITDLSAFAA